MPRSTFVFGNWQGQLWFSDSKTRAVTTLRSGFDAYKDNNCSIVSNCCAPIAKNPQLHQGRKNHPPQPRQQRPRAKRLHCLQQPKVCNETMRHGIYALPRAPGSKSSADWHVHLGSCMVGKFPPSAAFDCEAVWGGEAPKSIVDGALQVPTATKRYSQVCPRPTCCPSCVSQSQNPFNMGFDENSLFSVQRTRKRVVLLTTPLQDQFSWTWTRYAPDGPPAERHAIKTSNTRGWHRTNPMKKRGPCPRIVWRFKGKPPVWGSHKQKKSTA